MAADRNAEIAPKKWTLADVMGGDHQNASRVEAMTMIAASIDREALSKGISACDQALSVGPMASRRRWPLTLLADCRLFAACLPPNCGTVRYGGGR